MNKQNKIDVRGFAELVDQLEGMNNSHGHDLKTFIESFREMSSLMQKIEQVETKEEFEELEGRLHRCREGVTAAFEQFCQAQGKAVGEVYEYFEDPKNFSQEEWEETQAIRRKAEETVFEKTPPSSIFLARAN